MKKYFNIAGPCNPRKHYMLPAQTRCGDLMPLIDQEQYFVIHAARQSGKTTLLKDLVQELNEGPRYYGLYCSLESVQGIEEPKEGVAAVVRSVASAVEDHPLLQNKRFAEEVDYTDFSNVLRKSLSRYCARLDRPLVVLFDEADCLSEGTLISFLRQLREGYIRRPETPFVHSLALVGMRNIRDYKAQVREGRPSLGSTSPFNIIRESLTLRNFTEAEIGQLYAQHTAETGQVFPLEVVARVYYWTRGQPWLVNALAVEIVERMLKKDYSARIEVQQVEEAVERLILRRDTHIDSLLERLKEERVRKIVQPMILGQEGKLQRLSDDYEYARDLGLIREERGQTLPANPLYGEVIVRSLSWDSQEDLTTQKYPYALEKYLQVGGGLDMNRMLEDFQAFWRENSEIWAERYDYKEAAPHLILMAFLQRVLNGGGRIVREMATGTRRLDLCVEYRQGRYPIELKIRVNEKTEREGLDQVLEYMKTLGCEEGWLIVFDRRVEVGWDTKIYRRTEEREGHKIYVLGC